MRWWKWAQTGLWLVSLAAVSGTANAEEATWKGDVDEPHGWFDRVCDASNVSPTPVETCDYVNWENNRVPSELTDKTSINNGGWASISSSDQIYGDANAGKLLVISGGSGIELEEGGSLTAIDEQIGDDTGGSGTFKQSGGTHSVTGTLGIGAEGTYSLLDGVLSTTSVENEGIFEQRGGQLTTTTFTNSAGGQYEHYDGTFTGSLVNDGTFKQEGGELTTTTFTNNAGGKYQYYGGTFTGSLVNDGTATFDPTGTAFFDADISGDGELTKLGDGTLVLTGTNNTYGGGTLVSSGVLQGNALSLPGDITNNATVVFDQAEPGIYSGTVSGDGKVVKLGDATLILSGTNTYSGGTLVSSGVLQGNALSLQGVIANNATVVFDQAEPGIYAGSISGIGNVVKENGGLLTFNGSSNYTGGTQILGGNLQIGDAAYPGASILGPVSVGTDGTLSGHGEIKGNVNNAGTIAPGGSIGELTVTGNVAFRSGSTYLVAVEPAQSSRLVVDGSASLGGAQVEAIAADGAYGPSRYTILSAGSLDGRFADQLISNFAAIDPLLTPSLAYDANDVYLDLNPVPQQMRDTFEPAEEVASDLVYMIDRMATGRFNQAMGELCPEALGFWARGFGMISSASATGESPGYDADTSGFVLGVDRQVTDRLSLGIVGFGADIDVTTNNSFIDRSTVEMRGFNLYGAYTHGAWQLRSALGYSNESYTSEQTIFAGAHSRRAHGSTDVNRISNYTEGSYTFKWEDASLQPVVAAQLGWMEQDEYTQKGLFADGQGLNVSGRTQYVLDALVGGRARRDSTISENMKLQAEFRALYVHRFGDLEDSIDGTLTGGQAIALGTQDRSEARDGAILGAGVTLLTANGMNVYLDYNGQFFDGQTSSFFSAGLRYVW